MQQYPSFDPQMPMSPEMMDPTILYNQMNRMAINQLMGRGQQLQQMQMQQRLQPQRFFGMGSRPLTPWSQIRGSGMFNGGPMQNYLPRMNPWDVPPGGFHYTNPNVMMGPGYAYVGPGRMPPMTPQLPPMTQFLQQQQQLQMFPTPPPQLFNLPMYAQQMYGVNMFPGIQQTSGGNPFMQQQFPGMNQIVVHVPGVQ